MLRHHTPAFQLTTGQALQHSIAPCGYCYVGVAAFISVLILPMAFLPKFFLSSALCLSFTAMTGVVPACPTGTSLPAFNPVKSLQLLQGLWALGPEAETLSNGIQGGRHKMSS